jgi:hypothetical protein
VEPFAGLRPNGRLQALPANIRLGWNGLLGTNTLAYYGRKRFLGEASLTVLKRVTIGDSLQ